MGVVAPCRSPRYDSAERVLDMPIQAAQREKCVREYFWYRTRAGVFWIERLSNGWSPRFEEEVLMGLYPSAQHALDDLAGGYTDWPPCGDPSELGLPEEIGAWHWQTIAR